LQQTPANLPPVTHANLGVASACMNLAAYRYPWNQVFPYCCRLCTPNVRGAPEQAATMGALAPPLQNYLTPWKIFHPHFATNRFAGCNNQPDVGGRQFGGKSCLGEESSDARPRCEQSLTS
jgi:hypothetical protein